MYLPSCLSELSVIFSSAKKVSKQCGGRRETEITEICKTTRVRLANGHVQTHTHTWKHKYLKVDDKNLLMSEIMETKIGTIHPTALTRTVHSDRRLHFNFPQYRRGQEEFHTSNVQLITYNIQHLTSNLELLTSNRDAHRRL